MAELNPKERLLPSLLDRLTDDKPNIKEEPRDSRASSMQSLRTSVMRDLEWLMNTVNLESIVDLQDYPDIAESVLNFGLPGLAGNTRNSAELLQIEKLIKQAIQAFEPRILKNTVRVKLIENAELENRHAIAFQIEGTLWGRPMPEALYLHTELDLELGEVKIKAG